MSTTVPNIAFAKMVGQKGFWMFYGFYSTTSASAHPLAVIYGQRDAFSSEKHNK